MLNTITYPANNAAKQRKFVVSKRNLPYKNNFTQLSAAVFEDSITVRVLVQCTADSREPGRIYACLYNIAGSLQGCVSIN